MRRINTRQLWRLGGYLVGYSLFFAPFALFQRTLQQLLAEPLAPTIHNLCLRIPIEHLLNGRWLSMGSVAIIGLLLLIVVAGALGPVVCGRLCPVGAVGEYLSKILPNRFKLNWSRHVPIVPLRYGYLLGFMLAPLFGNYLACAYCNYYVFDLVFNYSLQGNIVAYSSSLIFTAGLWLGLFGLFTQGGRGFCNFLCPVGALQALVHVWWRRSAFGYGLNFNQDQCIGCGRCQQVCPMTCITKREKRVEINYHHCILCGECSASCPKQALHYARRKGVAQCQVHANGG